MSKEFFEAVKMLEAEKGIPADYLYEKISAAILNAQIFMNIQKEYGSFDSYIWHFTDAETVRFNIFPPHSHNELSDIISQDLKRRGMKYVGSTIIYSYLQAIGVINDHEPECFCAKTQSPS